MAYKNVPLLHRFIILDVQDTAQIIVNRQSFALNAGKYQIDAKGGIWSLEVDETISVEYSPVKIEWLTSLSGVPVVGPLTDDQLRAAPVPVVGPLTNSQLRAEPLITKKNYRLFTHLAGHTQGTVAAALNTAFPEVPSNGCLKAEGYFGTNQVFAIRRVSNNWEAYHSAGSASFNQGSAVTIGQQLNIIVEE